MAITDIILQKPLILVRQTSSGSLGIEVENVKYEWGTVDKVYSTSDRVTIGNSILFKVPPNPLFTVSGIKYYIINEDVDVSFVESPLP